MYSKKKSFFVCFVLIFRVGVNNKLSMAASATLAVFVAGTAVFAAVVATILVYKLKVVHCKVAIMKWKKCKRKLDCDMDFIFVQPFNIRNVAQHYNLFSILGFEISTFLGTKNMSFALTPQHRRVLMQICFIRMSFVKSYSSEIYGNSTFTRCFRCKSIKTLKDSCMYGISTDLAGACPVDDGEKLLQQEYSLIFLPYMHRRSNLSSNTSFVCIVFFRKIGNCGQ